MHRHMMLFGAVAAIALAADKGAGGGGKTDAEKAADAAAAAAKTPTEQANETNGGKALTEPASTHDGEFTDLTEANLAVIDLRAQLESQKIAHENEAADLRSRATAAELAIDDLKARMVAGTLTTTQLDQANEALGDVSEEDPRKDLVEVRVKTPMLVQPHVDPRHDEFYDGPIPAPFPLARGLNYAPRWVAEHWVVKANLEPDPA